MLEKEKERGQNQSEVSQKLQANAIKEVTKQLTEKRAEPTGHRSSRMPDPTLLAFFSSQSLYNLGTSYANVLKGDTITGPQRKKTCSGVF